MAKVYTVVQGDHLSGIALQNGFRDFNTIWNDGANADLAAKRDPHVLAVGDQVTIPDRQRRTTTRSTDATHTFKVASQPLFLKLKLLDVNGVALADIECSVGVDAKEGTADLTADGDGKVEEKIPRSSKTGEVQAFVAGDAPPAKTSSAAPQGSDAAANPDATNPDATSPGAASGDGAADPANPDDATSAGGEGGSGGDAPAASPASDPIKYDLRIGHLNPVFKMSGQQARLNNMGYFAGFTLKDLDQLLWAAEEFACETTKARVTARPVLAPPAATTTENDGKDDPDAETGVQDAKLRDLILKTHGV